MNKIQKMISGFAVVALMFSFLAFKSADKNVKFVKTYYALSEDGTTYRKAGPDNPSINCETELTFPSCVISYPDDNHDEELPASSLPDSPSSESGPGWIEE